MAGKPVIKETRLAVEDILNLLVQVATTQDVLEEYQGLTSEDAQASLAFAAKSLADTSFMPMIEQIEGHRQIAHYLHILRTLAVLKP